MAKVKIFNKHEISDTSKVSLLENQRGDTINPDAQLSNSVLSKTQTYVLPQEWRSLSEDVTVIGLSAYKDCILSFHKIDDKTIMQLWNSGTTVPKFETSILVGDFEDVYVDHEEGSIAITRTDGSLRIIKVVGSQKNPKLQEAYYSKEELAA